MVTTKYSGIKLVPTETAGSWFQSIQRKIGSNKYSQKNRMTRNWFQPIRREIDFNQYREKYFAGNSSNQNGGTLVPINTTESGFQPIQREKVPTNTSENRFQPIQREI